MEINNLGPKEVKNIDNFEPTCETCTVGSYASLSVCLSVCLFVCHSQKRLISYLWKWGKIVGMPHFQDEENLDGFPVQGNAEIATIANKLFSKLGKFLPNNTHQHKH